MSSGGVSYKYGSEPSSTIKGKGLNENMSPVSISRRTLIHEVTQSLQISGGRPVSCQEVLHILECFHTNAFAILNGCFLLPYSNHPRN
jgi:hypothetical protein